MTPSRLVRVVFTFALLFVASFASAATTDFRVFFDTDRNPATGCTVGGMDGVEQVLTTQVTDTQGGARVTRTQRQICTAGALGAATDVDTSGWDARFQSGPRELTFETRIALTAFGPNGITRDMRVGFDATRTPALHSALVDDDGSDIVLPESVRRRASRSPGNARTITLDGLLTDWAELDSIVYGMASEGSQELRLLRILSWEDVSENPANKFLYFAVTARLSSDLPYADDDVYNRNPGQSLSVPGPGVLANDGDPLGQDMDALIVTEPKRGSVALNEEEGGFTYSPDNPQSKATDSFEYKVRAGSRESNVARVKIKVRDGEGNEPPSFTPGGDVTVQESSGLYDATWATNISPGFGESQTVSFTVTNDNNGLFSTQPTISPDGKLRFVPTPNQNGSAVVTVVLTDSEGAATTPITFVINVTNVNSPPSFNVGPNQTVAEDSGPQTVNPWATSISPGPADESGQTVHFTIVSNTNPSLFSAGPSISPTGVLTYTPAPNANGVANISIRLTDNGSPAASSGLRQFSITITPVNDNPSFTAGGGVNVLEDSGAYSATWATAISAGPLEPAQTVFFTVTNDSNALFAAQPVIAPNGTLTFTPAANAFGSANVSVTLFDNLGGSTAPAVMFVINVASVNDVPSFVKGPDMVVLDTAGPQAGGWANSVSAGPANESLQILNFIVNNDAPGLFTVAPSIAPNGALSFTPAAGQSGVANVTVQIHDDGGTANGGADTSTTQTFTITVEKVPTITSANTTTFLVGTGNSFTVTTSGLPKPSIAQGGALPAGVTFVDGTGSNKGTGVLSGNPAPGTGGSYPITFQATNPHGSSPVQNFTLIVNEAASITSSNTATFTQGAAGSFTVTTIGYPDPSIMLTGASLPAGLTFVDNLDGTATISGTPTAAGGSYTGFTLTASNGVGPNAVQGLTIIINQAPVITSANSTGFNATVPGTFTVTTTGFPAPSLGETGALPTGITFTDNGNGTATLGGTALQGTGGVYPITITATNTAGSFPQSFTITVCNQIAVINPATTSGPAGSPFSQTFTQTGAVGSATFTLASGVLPTGLTLSTAGVLSGTPTQGGSFPITVMVTDANGCTGVGGTYNLVIICPTITVNNPANGNGTANSAFSETFTQTGGVGTATFALTSGTLPTGLTLAANGVLSGTPTQTGSFPITVTATDSNGCTGTGTTYTINIACQTITVNNPANANGTANSAFSETFTNTGAIGAVTYTLASGSLPTGLTLATNGTLSGTPTQTGSFPITVTATDSNGCTGTGATYTIVIACQTITVTNPVNTSGTVSAPFSETFTQTGAIGTATFTTASTLPAGLTLSAAGVLSGTPLQTGSFPIVVTATDSNGCTGTGATYTLVIGCQTITVTNPANGNGTASAAFSETFTQSGAVGGATFTLASGVLPAGLTLATNGVLSGIPTQTGSFPITVTVTDGNSCTGTGVTYTITIACQTITVVNPANATGPAGSPFSETFTNTGAIGTATYSLASGTLPTGLTLAPTGVLSGTPTQGGTFPITVTVTDSNGCTGTGATYTLIITCPTITVINPANGNGTASSPFSETFTQTGGIGTATFTLASGTLPTGLTLAPNGVLSGTPTQTGNFPITVTATDINGCTGTGTTYTIVIGCQTITVNNPANGNGTANSPFSETFTNTGAIGAVTYSLASGTLPTGLTLATNGTLSGTPTQTGSFPITVKVTDSNGCSGTGTTYTIVIACQTITVNNPANGNGTANSPFSETFTNTGAIGTTTYALASGTLPTGLTLAPNGTLSGTPTQTGSFPITVTATDSNGCQGTGTTYTITIACQTITVTSPANGNGTVSAAFSETFTQSGAIGTATFSLNSGVLPAGLTLAANGVVSGIPTQTGSFPITVKVTDSNGCIGTSTTYTITIGCQVITVNNPATTTGPAGSPFSQTFTNTGAIGSVTYALASGSLPTGLTLAANGTLSGTPTQGGTFPITVTVTDANGCTGTGPTYNLVITCPVITVNNPANANGTAGSAFSETFTQTGGLGTITYTLASGTLPSGLTLAPNGVLSGTPTQVGNFPITVTATDANNCTGTGTTYTIVIGCQTITVNNPATSTGTANAPFSQTFTAPAAIGTATFTLASGVLPAGLTLATNGTLSGTPTQVGSFPITVKVTDSNGCTGTSATYNLTIACQVITVTNPATTTGTVSAPFSQTFTQSGAIGTATFTTASTLPAGLTLSTAGVLSGTPTQPGSFPITVIVTDANGCTGTGATYTLVIGCQTITVNNPANANGTVGTLFNETFTQSGAIGTANFTINTGVLPAGLTLSTAGVLSGTPTQSGNFPITVKVTDSNGCTGISATYTIVIVCQVITVTNPGVTTGTVDAPFSQTFTQSGAIGTATFTTSSTLPSGLTLSTAGVLSGTPGAPGSFPITVVVTDSNGCTGTSTTYNLVIGCQTITVTNPATTTGTVDAPFSQTFTQTGVGTHTPVVWSVTGALPSGITLNTSTGVLSGTPGQPGSFPITVKATDANGCSGTGATYTLVIACQTITVTNPGVSAATYNAAFSQTFTQVGVGTHTPIVWSVTGTLPSGITMNSASGVLSGTPLQTGTFPITVTATDANGCAGTGVTYTLSVAPVAVADSYANGVNNTQYVLTGGTTATPATPSVQLAGSIRTNDQPAGFVTVVAGTFATSGGGSVTIAADGTFLYTPPAAPGGAAIASDTFTYTVTSNTGGVNPVTSAPATVTINLANRVWYVRNNAAAGGNGQSQSPFNILASAQTASTANDYIFVYLGDGTSTNQQAGFTMKNGQKLYGQHVGLTVNAQPLVAAAAGSRPLIRNNNAAAVTSTNLTGVEIKGLSLSTNGSSGDGIFASTSGASTGSIEISDNVITTVKSEGIDIDAGSTTSFTVSLHDNSVNSDLNAIDISRTAGTLTITAFDDNTVDGNTTGSGIVVSGAVFDTVAGAPFTTVSGGNTAIGAVGNPVSAAGMVLTGVAGDLSFTNLNIFTSAGNALTASGSGVFNAATATGLRIVATSGTDTFSATGGAAVNITAATVNLTPAVINSATTTTFGVNLDTVAGTFTAGSSSTISNPGSAAATAYRINGSSVNATYAGTIAMTQGTGVSLTTNTGTYAFTGQLTLSTATNPAFTATSSGTVSSTNTNSTITTTTGAAVNVASTNIAAANLIFKSITAGTAASGPAIGVLLNNTGTTAGFGGLQILGGAAAGNGGTIQRCGTGISLTSTRGVVLNDINMSNFTDWAIRGASVVNFTGDNLQISGTNGDNDATDDGSIRFTELTGSATLSNSSVSGGWEDNIVVVNTSGTLNRITISNTAIGANGTTFGDNGILFEGSGTATLNATVTGCTFTSTRGDHVQYNAAGGSPIGDFILQGNTFSNSHPSTVSGAGGIRVTTGASGSTPAITYAITGNTINGARGTAIGTTEGAGSGSLNGSISGNFIGTAAVANSGSLEGSGISVVMADLGTHIVSITNNDVRQYNINGIFVQAGGGASASSGNLRATVTGNAVGNFGNNAAVAPPAGRNGFHLNSGTFPGDTFSVCLDLGGAGALENSLVGSGDGVATGQDFRLRQRQNTVVRLTGYAGANNDDAAVVAYVQNRNTGTPSGNASNNSAGWSGAACPF